MLTATWPVTQHLGAGLLLEVGQDVAAEAVDELVVASSCGPVVGTTNQRTAVGSSGSLNSGGERRTPRRGRPTRPR